MATEVTLVIYDPRGRSADWWWDVLVEAIEDRGGELIESDEQEA